MPSTTCFDIRKIMNKKNHSNYNVSNENNNTNNNDDIYTISETSNNTNEIVRQKNIEKESKKRSKMIEKELKKSGKIFKSTIKLLLLGTGESGKSTVLKQMRIIHTSKFTIEERKEKINDIKSNIRDSILSILEAMDRFGLKLENPLLNDSKEFIFDNIYYLIRSNKHTNSSNQQFFNNNVANYPNKKKDSINSNNSFNEYNQLVERLWDSIKLLWKDSGVKTCAKRGNEYHLIDSAQYFLDRIDIIRRNDYLPDDQDILRCRVLTTGIMETNFFVKKVNFHIFDVGGQRDQRRKWIQCFNQVTAIIFIVDISSFNMTLREDHNVNRLKESLQSFRQIWINRYLYHISIILFLNKYDILVKKIVEEKCKLEDYFPEFKQYKLPNHIDKHLIVQNENIEVTKAKMFILEQFIKITNEKLIDAKENLVKYSQILNNENNTRYKTINSCNNINGNFSSINNSFSPVYQNKIDESSYTQSNSNDLYSNNNTTILNNEKYEKLKWQIIRSYYEAEEETIIGKFCIPHFTTAVDTDNIKRVFKACSHILKKEHLEKCGLL
jgi:GTPase SAR1 family protein